MGRLSHVCKRYYTLDNEARDCCTECFIMIAGVENSARDSVTRYPDKPGRSKIQLLQRSIASTLSFGSELKCADNIKNILTSIPASTFLKDQKRLRNLATKPASDKFKLNTHAE